MNNNDTKESIEKESSGEIKEQLKDLIPKIEKIKEELTQPGEKEFSYPDAYCLMRYRCEKCGTDEMIWNSRNGVTSFMVDCEVCGGTAQHVDWDQDIRVKDFKPKPGTRIFIDLTIKKMKEYKTKYVEKYWEHGKHPMKDHPAFCDGSKEDAVNKLSIFEKGTPDLITVEGK